MNILVTGASGFLGGALIAKLCCEGHTVRGVSRNKPTFEHPFFSWSKLDLSDLSQYDCLEYEYDAVVHTAAKAGFWGDLKEYYAANVQATQYLLEKSIAWGVKAFVFTSSPSVVFNGSQNLCNVNESVSYPKKYYCHYSYTKMLAEQLVLSKKDKIRVVVLRPHLIYGPGDNHLLPRVLEKAKKGKLKKIGSRKNQVDIIFIDNCVHGHIQSLEVLLGPEFHKINGKVYFISDEKPVELWVWINKILMGLDCKPVVSSISFKLAFILGWSIENIFKVFKINTEPPLTRFVVNSLSTDHYFDQSAAKNDFGYNPQVNEQEAFERTLEHLKALF